MVSLIKRLEYHYKTQNSYNPNWDKVELLLHRLTSWYAGQIDESEKDLVGTLADMLLVIVMFANCWKNPHRPGDFCQQVFTLESCVNGWLWSQIVNESWSRHKNGIKFKVQCNASLCSPTLFPTDHEFSIFYFLLTWAYNKKDRWTYLSPCQTCAWIIYEKIVDSDSHFTWSAD